MIRQHRVLTRKYNRLQKDIEEEFKAQVTSILVESFYQGIAAANEKRPELAPKNVEFKDMEIDFKNRKMRYSFIADGRHIAVDWFNHPIPGGAER